MTRQINLYSPLFRKQKKLFTSRAMVQALALVLVTLMLSYTYARFQVTILSRQANEFDEQVRGQKRKESSIAVEGKPAAKAGRSYRDNPRLQLVD